MSFALPRGNSHTIRTVYSYSPIGKAAQVPTAGKSPKMVISGKYC